MYIKFTVLHSRKQVNLVKVWTVQIMEIFKAMSTFPELKFRAEQTSSGDQTWPGKVQLKGISFIAPTLFGNHVQQNGMNSSNNSYFSSTQVEKSTLLGSKRQWECRIYLRVQGGPYAPTAGGFGMPHSCMLPPQRVWPRLSRVRLWFFPPGFQNYYAQVLPGITRARRSETSYSTPRESFLQ